MRLKDLTPRHAMRLAKLLYWRLTVPDSVSIFPVPKIQVASGPFRGMRYIQAAYASALSAKILGTYEKELHPCIEAAMAIPFERIVNVGAAEGYYAVGFARRGESNQHVIAFEADEVARRLICQLADQNHISNLTIHGHCAISDLDAVVPPFGNVLIICDVEGFEADLLDPAHVRNLARAWILVELHEFECAGVTKLIYNRFNRTHYIEEISSVRRRWMDFPAQQSVFAILTKSLAVRAMNEFRPSPMSWLWMRPVG